MAQVSTFLIIAGLAITSAAAFPRAAEDSASLLFDSFSASAASSSTTTLDVVIDKFALHDVQSLAVLDDAGDGSVLGLITRERLMQRYQTALAGD